MWISTRSFVFGIGFIIGAIFALIIFNRRNSYRHPVHSTRSCKVFSASIVHNDVKVACVIATGNISNANVKAINATWAKSCDYIYFYNNARPSNDKKHSNKNHAVAKSSFHILCDAIRNINEKFVHLDWAIFVKDDMFVVPENLRYLSSILDASKGHYLGHAINFWNVDYNIATAGFVLSKGAIKMLINKFPNSDTCISGGKYWKQEDLYLGKHLRSFGIFPTDTRDEKENTLFLGYDLDKIIFPNSVQQLSNYYVRAIYPVKCCSHRTITFQVLSSTEIYKYYYMIYTVQIAKGDSRNDLPPSTETPDDFVWKDFLRERGLPMNVSSREYEKSWYVMFDNTTAFPGVKNINRVRDTSSAVELGTDEYFNLTNASELLADILKNYSLQKSLSPKLN